MLSILSTFSYIIKGNRKFKVNQKVHNSISTHTSKKSKISNVRVDARSHIQTSISSAKMAQLFTHSAMSHTK